MPLTPLDIHKKEFGRSFRGYDEDEVNDFLNQIIKDYELLIREKREIEEKLASQTERLTYFSNIEDTLNKSIIIAQETAEEVKRNALKESKLLIREAEKNADRIVEEALSKARRIAVETEELKKQSKVFRTRFKMLMEAQLDLLGGEDWDSLLDFEVDTAELDELSQDEM